MQPINSGSPRSQDLMPSRNLATRPSSEVFRKPGRKSIGQQLAASSSSFVDMEQESEGGQAAAMQALDVDSKVRAEVNLGFQQIRTIEQQLRTAPQGFLGRADVSEAQALRMTLLSASATIVCSFTRIVRWLSAPPPTSTSFRNDNFSASDRIGRAESPLLSTSHTYDSDTPHSPRPRVSPTAAAAMSKRQRVINSTSPVMSPCHTPHSGSGMSEDSANPSSPPVLLDADGDAAPGAANTVAGAGRPRRLADEATTSADPEGAKQRSLSVKRKFMPKFNCKQRASDPGHDGPPDDGYTWRKYGQKDILGSRNPRSYYRCTHKIELSCLAIKYVQRCDDEPMMFDVTYRGNHTCQSIHQQHPAWPFSCSPEQMAMLSRVHHLVPSEPTSSAAIINYPSLGGNHVNFSDAQSQALTSSDEILLGGGRHGFSQLAGGLPVGGGILSTTGILDLSSDPRFLLNPPPSMELGMHQQDFPVKPEDNNLSQPPVFEESRFSRDTIFSPDQLFMLLANSRSAQNDIPSTLGEGGLTSERKEVKVQHPAMELARSGNSGQVDKSTESQYGARWEAELDANFQLQLEEQVPCRYGSKFSIISECGQSRPALPNDQMASEESSRIASIKQSGNSIQTPVSSLPMVAGFTMDGMEYDFPGSTSFYC